MCEPFLLLITTISIRQPLLNLVLHIHKIHSHCLVACFSESFRWHDGKRKRPFVAVASKDIQRQISWGAPRRHSDPGGRRVSHRGYSPKNQSFVSTRAFFFFETEFELSLTDRSRKKEAAATDPSSVLPLLPASPSSLLRCSSFI